MGFLQSSSGKCPSQKLSHGFKIPSVLFSPLSCITCVNNTYSHRLQLMGWMGQVSKWASFDFMSLLYCLSVICFFPISLYVWPLRSSQDNLRGMCAPSSTATAINVYNIILIAMFWFFRSPTRNGILSILVSFTSQWNYLFLQIQLILKCSSATGRLTQP